jgi:hypothetical protein
MSGPNLRTHRRIDSWLTISPRLARRSSNLRPRHNIALNGYRRGQVGEFRSLTSPKQKLIKIGAKIVSRH